MKVFLPIVLFTLFTVTAFSQSTYTRYLNHAGKADYASKIVALPDGSAVLASWDVRDSILQLIKVNMGTGGIAWHKQYHLVGNALDEGFISSFQYTSDNHLLLGANYLESQVNSGFNNTYLTALAFDTAGNMLWNIVDFDPDFGTPLSEIAPGRCLMITDRNYNSNLVTKSQLMKVNSTNGSVMAGKELSFFNTLSFLDAMPVSGRRCLLTGYAGSFYGVPYHYDAVLAKVDTSLNVVWAKAYRDTLVNSIAAVAPYTNGGWLLLGTTFYDGTVENGAVVMAVDSNGVLLWAKKYADTLHTGNGAPLHFTGATIIPTSDGNYLIGGSYQVAVGNNPNVDGIVMKIDPSGNVLSTRSYGIANDPVRPVDAILALADRGSGSYFFAGRTGYNSQITVLYGVNNFSSPTTCFSTTPNIISSNVTTQIKDTAINITSTSYTFSVSFGNFTVLPGVTSTDTIACGPNGVGTAGPTSGSLMVYPNPAHGGTINFNWSGQLLKEARLCIYDPSGKLVETSIFNGTHASIESRKLNAGMYYYTLSGSEGVRVRGRILVE